MRLQRSVSETPGKLLAHLHEADALLLRRLPRDGREGRHDGLEGDCVLGLAL